uniref:Uncharacterized protein n=1 Tax=Manihot esculenta TaxID=3983 RepID=A0A2C9UUV9_MANES
MKINKFVPVYFESSVYFPFEAVMLQSPLLKMSIF